MQWPPYLCPGVKAVQVRPGAHVGPRAGPAGHPAPDLYSCRVPKARARSSSSDRGTELLIMS